MNTNNFDPNNKILNCWINKPETFQNMFDFQKWFDSASSLDEVISKAKIDWEKRITNFDLFENMKKDNCLEIGFGGGRLLYHSTKTFNYSFGIDIHTCFKKTEEFLKSQEIYNYKLIHRKDTEHIPEYFFDFVYSFIVFQHFHNFDEVNFYLSLIKNVLKPKGIAHIFFGKSNKDKHKLENPSTFKDRHCSLWLNPELFRKHVKEKGFEILNYKDILPKKPLKPIGPNNISGQASILFRKP